jgi:hypothetical protein
MTLDKDNVSEVFRKVAPRDGFSRYDFVIKDLVVSVAGGTHGGRFMPGPDDPTPPPTISPIAAILVHAGLFDAVRQTVVDAVNAKRFDDIGRAFVAGDEQGNVVLRNAIQEIGSAVVASAAYTALGGADVGYINPDCGGTSYETIPPTITPVVHIGYQVHRVTELPRLRQQLAQTLAYVDGAAAEQAPRGAEVDVVRAQLESALKSLG